MCCSVISSQNNIQKGVGRGRVFWAWACKTATEAWVAFFIFFLLMLTEKTRKYGSEHTDPENENFI